MPISGLTLDDLTWRGMVDAIRRRIPAISRGEWTLHAPVDPGITLLEVYAWLLEQRLFWLDQVPDSFVRGALRLLGIRPAGAIAARTVLQVTPIAGAPSPITAIARGTTFELEDSDPPIRLTTDDALFLLDIVDNAGGPQIEVTACANNMCTALREQSPLPLFAADGSASEVEFAFRLRSAPGHASGSRISMLIDLDVAPALAPQWSPTDVRDAPPPAKITWSYNGNSGRMAFATGAVHDGTGGFRRPGIVSFPVPADWTAAPATVGQPLGFSIWARVTDSTFTYPPRLIRAVPNVAVATHCYPARRAPYRVDWLPLPTRELPLALDARNNFDGDGPIERSIRVRLLERDGVWHKWTPTDDLTRHRSFSRKFVVDRERQCLIFGDGYFGRIPHLQTAGIQTNVEWRGWMGGGSRGNVGSGLNWNVETSGAAVVVNVTPAIGGQDPESISTARSRGSGVIRRVTRAVTAADFEYLACSTPGVSIARARAAPGVHPGHACLVADAMTVYVVPWAPRGPDISASEFIAKPQPDPGILAAVNKHLGRARLIGTALFLSAVRYRAISIEVTVSGDVRDPLALEAALRSALTSFLDPLEGGDGGGWPFGEPPRASAILRVAETAAGPGVTIGNVSIALEGTPAAACQDVVIGPNDLVWLQQMTLRLDHTLTLTGGLR
jgi:hypothetical protein